MPPTRATPHARLGLALSAPVLGAAAAAAIALAAGQPLALAELQAPVAGAWLVMAIVQRPWAMMPGRK